MNANLKIRGIFPALAAAALTAAPIAAQEAPRLHRAEQQQVVDSIGRVLRARYVDEQVAERVAGHLRERVAAGAYDADTLPAALAGALTRDMYAVSRDLHMRLSWEPTREFTMNAGQQRTMVPAGQPGVMRTGRIDPRDSVTLARNNFAYSRVERLEGNVGYVKLDEFQPLDYARETVAAAMAFLANTDAVIIDLRDNRGGAPDHVRLLMSYFFGPDSVKLWATTSRGLGITNEYWSVADLPGRRMAGADLYVLTSGRTASSAETFSYVARQTGRGTVIGERTSGAGNGGAQLSVGFGLALFVPQWQMATGPGFERTGVLPDVAVPEDEALGTARTMALQRLIARGGDPQVQRARAWALEAAAPRPTFTAEQLARYTGAYGTRRVEVRDGGLVLLSANGFETRLAPIADGLFRADEATRIRFDTDDAGRAVALTVERATGEATHTPRASEAAAGH